MYVKSMVNNDMFDIKFKKAILVGSSGDIIGENKGEFINSFPVIIRMR